ncbi:MAG: hypothetical protein Q7U16_06950 [Agitococcus sp.]|nr:hypothetical protein [Agitococcus sp.]
MLIFRDCLCIPFIRRALLTSLFLLLLTPTAYAQIGIGSINLGNIGNLGGPPIDLRPNENSVAEQNFRRLNYPQPDAIEVPLFSFQYCPGTVSGTDFLSGTRNYSVACMQTVFTAKEIRKRDVEQFKKLADILIAFDKQQKELETLRASFQQLASELRTELSSKVDKK